MSSKWAEYSLLEIYDVTNGLNKNKKEFGFGYPFLTFKEVFSNYFVPEELTSLANTNPKERNKCSIQAGDVFITRTSETFDELGMSCVAIKDYPDASFNGFCKRLRPKGAAEIDARYSAFFFNGPEFRQQVLSLANMSTRASLNNDMLKKLAIRLPPLDVQQGIAKVLTDLQDKIQLNHQINQTLEQMAQAIFKSWFVDFEPVKAKIAALEAGGSEEDALLAAMQAISANSLFDADASAAGAQAELARLQAEQPEQYAELRATAELFPSAMQDSELGEIPEGWVVSKIGDEVTVVGGGTPSTKNPAFWEDGQISWTSPKDLSNLPDKVLVKTERKITEAGLAKISSGLLPVDTVLMSSRAPVGYLALAKIPLAVNQGYIAMKCEKVLTPAFVIQWCQAHMDEIKNRASGTTFAEISKKNFNVIPTSMPTEGVISAYTKLASKLYSAIESNVRETHSLSKLRDSLLPQLLSGKITVADAEE